MVHFSDLRFQIKCQKLSVKSSLQDYVVRCSKVIICSSTFATARYPLLLFLWKEEAKENYVNLFILDFFEAYAKPNQTMIYEPTAAIEWSERP